MTQTARPARREPQDEESSLATRQPSPGMIAVAESRAAQEVQAAMIVAKRFPRDATASYNRIMEACRRKTLAEQALYAYPRGNETVTGPSIRMAEVLAQNWGNLDFGIIELEQRRGESVVMAYAWDLETNCRQTKVFTVRHERYTKRGSYALTDPRDIYEMCANQGARRVRACILGVIPGDIVDAAVGECEKTMAGNNTEPLHDRVRKMTDWFASKHGISQAVIEKRLGHGVDATSETELVQLKKIAKSLQDGQASREQFFEIEASARVADGKGRVDALADQIAGIPQRDAATQAALDAAKAKLGAGTPTDPDGLPADWATDERNAPPGATPIEAEEA